MTQPRRPKEKSAGPTGRADSKGVRNPNAAILTAHRRRSIFFEGDTRKIFHVESVRSVSRRQGVTIE